MPTAIHVVDADTGGFLFGDDADLVLPTASVGKVLLLTALAEALDSGAVSPDEELARSSGVGDSGLWQHLSVGALPVADLAVLVASVSDNQATNALVERLGLDVVQQIAPRAGLRDTQLHDVVRDHRGPSDPPLLSSGTAREWCEVMVRLHRGTWFTPEVSGRVLGWMVTNVDHSMVGSAFQLDPLAQHLELVNKTGRDHDVLCDVGLVRGSDVTWAYAGLMHCRHAHGMQRLRSLGVRLRQRTSSDPEGTEP